MLSKTYYAQNYAGIIGLGLHITTCTVKNVMLYGNNFLPRFRSKLSKLWIKTVKNR